MAFPTFSPRYWSVKTKSITLVISYIIMLCAVYSGFTMYLVAREETREVLSVPGALTRVPGAKQWIKGLANVRGQLLPIVDLRQFLGSGVTPMTRNTRIIVVNHREIPAGLVVDEVLGFRRFAEGEFSGDAPPTVARCERFLAGAFKRGAEQWPVLSLRRSRPPSRRRARGS